MPLQFLIYSLISVKMDEKMSASITPSFSVISMLSKSETHSMQVYEPKLFGKLDFTPTQLNSIYATVHICVVFVFKEIYTFIQNAFNWLKETVKTVILLLKI